MKKKSFLLKTLIACALMLLVFSVSAFAIEHGNVDKSTDGKVSAGDARLALRMSVGLEPAISGTPEFLAADVDFNGKITASDARSILRNAVGLEELTHKFSEALTPEEKTVGTAKVKTGRHYQSCTCGLRKNSFCNYDKRVYANGISQPTCVKGVMYTETCSGCGGKRQGSIKALGHDSIVIDSKPATCKDAGYVKYECRRKIGSDDPRFDPDKPNQICGEVTTKTLHKIEHPAVPSSKAFQITCPECKEKVYTTINDLINPLKYSPHTFSSFDKNTTATKITKNNIEFNPWLKSFMGNEDPSAMFGESFSGEKEIEFRGYARNYAVSEDSFPIFGSLDVSKLEDADINGKPVVTTGITSIDLLNDLKVEDIKSKSPYQETRIKNLVTAVKAKTDLNAYKVEVSLVKESYKALKKNRVAETALMRIQGTNLIEYAETVPSMGDLGLIDMDGADIDVDMSITEAVSNFKLVYYFDAATNNPLAAVYTLDISTDEKTNMYFAMDLGEALPIWIMKGSLEMNISDQMVTYYFFDGFAG